MEIDPKGLAIGDAYKLLIGSIVPRPIAFVSTISPDGRLNLGPFSFFNGIGSDPLSLLFCPVNKGDGSEKDSLRNAKPAAEGGVGEFVVNVAVEAYAEKVAASAEPWPYGESEFELVGLNPEPSRRVKPPRVAESPVSFECETLHVVRLNRGRAGGGNVVIGRIVWVRVRDDLVDSRHRIDPEKLAAVARMGGMTYARTRDRFDMPSGRAALAQAKDEAR